MRTIVLSGSMALIFTISCHVVDDGEFEIPADLVAPEQGIALVESTIDTPVDIDDETVWLTGRTSHSLPY